MTSYTGEGPRMFVVSPCLNGNETVTCTILNVVQSSRCIVKRCYSEEDEMRVLEDTRCKMQTTEGGKLNVKRLTLQKFRMVSCDIILVFVTVIRKHRINLTRLLTPCCYPTVGSLKT